MDDYHSPSPKDKVNFDINKGNSPSQILNTESLKMKYQSKSNDSIRK